eukprot:TRINITY_DN8695_c0_g4_i1.p1 TRINITY_DN8695_c0_g4~~TRINITY_DN8695_c0_g4_i1.p1  ORF type:complete len:1567 (+),score=533.91 TRINITY_DN8695_c0_g4_i1:195-4895(+)
MEEVLSVLCVVIACQALLSLWLYGRWLAAAEAANWGLRLALAVVDPESDERAVLGDELVSRAREMRSFKGFAVCSSRWAVCAERIAEASFLLVSLCPQSTGFWEAREGTTGLDRKSSNVQSFRRISRGSAVSALSSSTASVSPMNDEVCAVWCEGSLFTEAADTAEAAGHIARTRNGVVDFIGGGALVCSFNMWVPCTRRRLMAASAAVEFTAKHSGTVGMADGDAHCLRGQPGLTLFAGGAVYNDARVCCDSARHWKVPIAATEMAVPPLPHMFEVFPVALVMLPSGDLPSLLCSITSTSGTKRGCTVPAELSDAWHMLGTEGDVERGIALLTDHAINHPHDTHAQRKAIELAQWVSAMQPPAPAYVFRLKLNSCRPMELGTTDLCSMGSSQATTNHPVPLSSLFVAFVVAQPRDARTPDHAGIRVWRHAVQRYEGQVDYVVGDRLVARWTAERHSGPLFALRSATRCVRDLIGAGQDRLYGYGMAAGLADCGNVKYGSGFSEVQFCTFAAARWYAEALADTAVVEMLASLATEAFLHADRDLPWSTVLPDCRLFPQGSREAIPDTEVEVCDVLRLTGDDGQQQFGWVVDALMGTPTEVQIVNTGSTSRPQASRFQLRRGLYELRDQPASDLYSSALHAVEETRWTVAARLLHRCMEEAGSESWTARLYAEVRQAEKDEEAGRRACDERLWARVGCGGGLRFEPAALKRDRKDPRMISPRGLASGRGNLLAAKSLGRIAHVKSRSTGEIGRRSTASSTSSNALSLTDRPISGCGRFRKSVEAVAAAHRFLKTAGSPGVEKQSQASGSGTSGGSPLSPTRKFTLKDAAMELASLADDVHSEVSPANSVRSSICSSVGSAPVSPRMRTLSASPARHPLEPRRSGAEPAKKDDRSQLYVAKRGLLAMRDRDTVLECLNLPPAVPPRMLEGRERTESESTMQFWHTVASYWNVLRLTALMWNCAVIPAQAVYADADLSATAVILCIISYMFDVVYWGDVVLNFIEPIEQDGTLITDPRQIAHWYLRSWFAFDVVACFPWELGLLFYNTDLFLSSPSLRFNRCLNVARVHDLVTAIRNNLFSSAHPIKVQLFMILGCNIYMLHWLGCLWALVHVGPASEYGTEWERAAIIDFTGDDDRKVTEVIHGFHWALRGFAGYGMLWPRSDRHTLVALVCVTVGIFMFAVVIGYMWTLVQLLGSVYQSHVQKIDELLDFCEHMKVDHRAGTEMSAELVRYHRTLWARTRQAWPGQFSFLLHDGWDDSGGDVVTWATAAEMPEGLPPALARMMRYYVNFHAVESVPALRQSGDPVFVMRVVSRMEHRLCSPGEHLLVRGPAEGSNTGVFFIVRGVVEVRFGNGEKESLLPGDYWGEAAIINSDEQGADLVMLDYGEIYRLEESDFSSLLHDFPAVGRVFRESAQRRQRIVRARDILQLGTASDVLDAVEVLTTTSDDDVSRKPILAPLSLSVHAATPTREPLPSLTTPGSDFAFARDHSPPLHPAPYPPMLAEDRVQPPQPTSPRALGSRPNLRRGGRVRSARNLFPRFKASPSGMLGTAGTDLTPVDNIAVDDEDA